MNKREQLHKHSAPLSPRISIYRWHLTMVASGAHRGSGVVLILFVPFYLWLLHGMTGTPEQFDQSVQLLHSIFGRLTLLLAGTAFIYHLCNGIRVMFLDAGWGESRQMIRLSAGIVVGIAAITAVTLGCLLW